MLIQWSFQVMMGDVIYTWHPQPHGMVMAIRQVNQDGSRCIIKKEKNLKARAYDETRGHPEGGS